MADEKSGEAAKAETKVEASNALPAEVEKEVKIYRELDRAYRNAPAEAREKVDAFFKGNYDVFATKHNEKVQTPHEESIDPVSKLEQKLSLIEKQLEDAKKRVDGVDNVVKYDKISEARNKINVNYEQTFAELAETKGYKYGSDAYESLFDSAIKQSNILARKYGLVDDRGNPDPLLQFKPELVKEAFELAYDKHKKMGYSVEEQSRKEVLKEREENKKREEDRFSPYLKKENLKTLEGRAKAIKDMLRQSLREKGMSLDDFKMV